MSLRSLLSRWRGGQSAAPTFTKSVYGPDLVDTPGDLTFVLCATGYGPFIAETIAGYDREFLFLDIGANLGLFGLLADRHPLCRKVLAFEPLPPIFANLTTNIARNVASKVVPFQVAISDAGRDVYLSFDPGHSGMAKVLSRAGRGAVRAKTMGAAGLTRLVADWPGAIVAKIDVEGSEPAVLEVLQRTGFYRALDAIIIEISERNLSAANKARLLDLLAADGFGEVARSGPAEHYDAYYRRRHSSSGR